MSPRLHRWVAIFDVVGVSLLVATYIWIWQFTAPQIALIFPVWLGTSFLIHRDTPKTLGWRADNLWTATRQAALFLGIAVVVSLAIGLVLGMPKPPPQFFGVRRLWRYFAFCLLQQVALQSFLNNRLMALVSRRPLSSLLTGLIFGGLHWPNPVLVPVAFLGGSLMAWLFARHRNVIPFAVGQTILGSVVSWAFPSTWHHSMRVGPGYYLPF